MSVTLELQYGDWVQAADGTFNLVTGPKKCAQDVAESLKNNYDVENPSWFNGSELFLIDRDPVAFLRSGLGPELWIHTMVQEAITRLIDLQEADAFVDADELISEIRTLKVVKIGRMSYFFYLKVILSTDEEVDVQFKLNLLPELPPGMAASLNVGKNILRSDVQKTFL